MTTNTYTATVYSRPGCMRCHATARKLKALGIPVNTVQIDEHPDALDLMAREGWTSLPLVEVTGPEGPMYWHDMSTRDIDAVTYLIKGTLR